MSHRDPSHRDPWGKRSGFWDDAIITPASIASWEFSALKMLPRYQHPQPRWSQFFHCETDQLQLTFQNCVIWKLEGTLLGYGYRIGERPLGIAWAAWISHVPPLQLPFGLRKWPSNESWSQDGGFRSSCAARVFYIFRLYTYIYYVCRTPIFKHDLQYHLHVQYIIQLFAFVHCTFIRCLAIVCLCLCFSHRLFALV